MENNIVEHEEDEGISLSLKKIWNFVKLSATRMLIYVLILVVPAAGIVGLIEAFGTDSVSQGAIELLYPGADEGLLPGRSNGNFNSGNIISGAVVNRAVTEANLQGKITDMAELRKRLSVEGMPSAEYARLLSLAAAGNRDAQTLLAEFEFFPTRFIVRLEDNRGLGISRSEANRLVERIMRVFLEEFSRTHVVGTNRFSTVPLETNLDAFDFAEHYERFVVELQSISSYITERDMLDSNFRSADTGQAFRDLLARGEIVRSSLNNYSAFVNAHAVSNDRDAQIIILNNLIASRKIDIARITSNIEFLQDQIAAFELGRVIVDPGGAGVPPTIVIVHPPAYLDLQRRLTAAGLELSSVQYRMDVLQLRLDAFENLTSTMPEQEARERAEEILDNLSAEAIAFVEMVNETLAEFYERDFNRNMIRIVQIAAYAALDRNWMLYALIVGVAVLTGIVVAMIVTQVKKNKVQKRKAVAVVVDTQKE